MAGVFATIAFQWAARSDRYPELGSPYASQKLYYLTSGYKLPDRQAIAPPVITASIDIGPERFEKKDQAFRQHKTQQPLFELVRKNLDRPPLVELYHLACTREPHRGKFETDLLDRRCGKLIILQEAHLQKNCFDQGTSLDLPNSGHFRHQGFSPCEIREWQGLKPNSVLARLRHV